METLASLQEQVTALQENLAIVIRGKEKYLEVLTIALLAGGDVLMEDVPGVGKTTLAKALAKSIDLSYNRVQFTPDLLPADILGSSIYNPVTGKFEFHKGPIFCNILLADEINRASPRTQSALLEAMSERQTTIEGVLHPLAQPFLVIATQNPVEYHGTYPLPEAQLDRFLIQLKLGYPASEVELDVLYDQAQTHPLTTLQPVLQRDQLLAMQEAVRAVRVERTVGAYIIALVERTRRDERLKLGASPRASLMLFRAAQSAAFVAGRDYVLPDDVQRMARYVLPHRLMLTSKAKYGGQSKGDVINEILDTVAVPA